MKKQRSKSSYYFRKYFFIPLKILRISLIDVIRQDGVEHAGYLAFLSFLSFYLIAFYSTLNLNLSKFMILDNKIVNLISSTIIKSLFCN